MSFHLFIVYKPFKYQDILQTFCIRPRIFCSVVLESMSIDKHNLQCKEFFLLKRRELHSMSTCQCWNGYIYRMWWILTMLSLMCNLITDSHLIISAISLICNTSVIIKLWLRIISCNLIFKAVTISGNRILFTIWF